MAPQLRERLELMRTEKGSKSYPAATEAALSRAADVLNEISICFRGENEKAWRRVHLASTADGGAQFEMGDLEIWIEPDGRLLSRLPQDGDDGVPASLGGLPALVDAELAILSKSS